MKGHINKKIRKSIPCPPLYCILLVGDQIVSFFELFVSAKGYTPRKLVLNKCLVCLDFFYRETNSFIPRA